MNTPQGFSGPPPTEREVNIQMYKNLLATAEAKELEYWAKQYDDPLLPLRSYLGTYFNRCTCCGKVFAGQKRDTTCRICTSTTLTWKSYQGASWDEIFAGYQDRYNKDYPPRLHPARMI